ncbi:MAG: PAS domain-containing protein [Deltaproteobacteria bacterium]|nr:PAS domain-containing protein [Deltaproteobacteria bacterium]
MNSADLKKKAPGPQRRKKPPTLPAPQPDLLPGNFLAMDRAWELTFDAVSDAIAIIDNQHRILRVNRAMADRLGVPPEACIGQSCYRCVHGLDAPPDLCPHAQLLKDGSEHRQEVHEERLGGTFLVSTSPLRDPQGRLLGCVHVARDITERKEMWKNLQALNEELRETNADLKAAYCWMRDSRDRLKKYSAQEEIAFLVDREGRIEGLTEAAQEWSGRSRFDLAGGSVLELLEQGCRERVRQALDRAWFGIILPLRVETAATTNAPPRRVELKLTRLTCRGERRLWLVLYRPEDTNDGRSAADTCAG